MLPWVELDTADVPGDGGRLKLLRRGDEYSIKLDRTELMNSRLSGSEEALATLAAARIAGRRKPRVLVGGLGMGFTLRAALAVLPADAEIVVVELVPAVIAWARGPLAEVSGRGLEDRRVKLVEADVGAVIAAEPAGFDAILLDVDNGPDGLSRPSNDGLYDDAGLGLAKRALIAGGVLAVWSSAPDHRFSKRLRQAGFAVEESNPKAGRGRGARHVVWLAVKPGAAKAEAQPKPAGQSKAAGPRRDTAHAAKPAGSTAGRGGKADATRAAGATAAGSRSGNTGKPTSTGVAPKRAAAPRKPSTAGVDASGDRPMRRRAPGVSDGGPARPHRPED